MWMSPKDPGKDPKYLYRKNIICQRYETPKGHVAK